MPFSSELHIRKLRTNNDVQGLIQAFAQETNILVKLSAARALGDIGDKRAVEVLKNALRDESEDVRATVAEMLGRLADGRAVALLTEAIVRDPYLGVRLAATKALGEIRDESAVNSLMDVLEGKVSAARLTLVAEVRGVDLRDVEVKQSLREYLRAEEEEVQKVANQALKRVLQLEELTPESEESPYDLARLDLPREGGTWEGGIEKETKIYARRPSFGEVTVMTSYQDLAKLLPSGSPHVGAMDGSAFTVLRFEGLSRSEVQHMQDAVANNMLLLIPVLGPYPTFPVLALRFVIYDDLANPFVAEGPRNIRKTEIQNFLQAILRDGNGTLYLYAGVDAEFIAKGIFSLRVPPFREPGVPYYTHPIDLQLFWLLLNQAAKHLEQIPVAARDFEAAVDAYWKHTSL